MLWRHLSYLKYWIYWINVNTKLSYFVFTPTHYILTLQYDSSPRHFISCFIRWRLFLFVGATNGQWYMLSWCLPVFQVCNLKCWDSGRYILYCHSWPGVLLPLSYYIIIKTEGEKGCTFRVDSLHKLHVCPAVIWLMSGTCTHFGIVTWNEISAGCLLEVHWTVRVPSRTPKDLLCFSMTKFHRFLK